MTTPCALLVQHRVKIASVCRLLLVLGHLVYPLLLKDYKQERLACTFPNVKAESAYQEMHPDGPNCRFQSRKTVRGGSFRSLMVCTQLARASRSASLAGNSIAIVASITHT